MIEDIVKNEKKAKKNYFVKNFKRFVNKYGFLFLVKKPIFVEVLHNN